MSVFENYSIKNFKRVCMLSKAKRDSARMLEISANTKDNDFFTPSIVQRNFSIC